MNVDFLKTEVKGVLQKLANMLDELSSSLMDIYDNIKDLMIVFQKKDYVK